MQLEDQFPEGVVGIGGAQFLVRQGAYYMVIADRTPGSAWVLNALGVELTGAAPDVPKKRVVLKKPSTDSLADLDV